MKSSVHLIPSRHEYTEIKRDIWFDKALFHQNKMNLLSQVKARGRENPKLNSRALVKIIIAEEVNAGKDSFGDNCNNDVITPVQQYLQGLQSILEKKTNEFKLELRNPRPNTPYLKI